MQFLVAIMRRSTQRGVHERVSRVSSRVELVDYARCLAALSVVAFHYFYNGIENGKIENVSHISMISEPARYGYLGVDLFFMISGFVISSSASGKAARKFIVGRAVRLYPAFWAAVLITTAFAVFLGGPHMSVTVTQVLANFTMTPQVFDQPFVDGVYWTLSYELAFYALIFVLLLARQGSHLDVILCWWAIGMGLVSLALPNLAGFPLLGNYFCLFASGAVISSIVRTGWSLLKTVALVSGAVGAIPFQASLAVDKHLNPTIIIIISLCCYALLLSTALPRVARLRLTGSTLAGQLTYPLYLVHAYIGYMLINAFADESNKLAVTLAVLLFALGLAYALHMVIERWLRRIWYPFFDRTIGAVVGLLESKAPKAHT